MAMTGVFHAAIASVVLCAMATAGKPNLIHMVIDDWGHADVGYNNDQIISPFLDEMAANGTKLSNFYVYRFCSPSRSSFQTGRFPWHIGQQTSQNLNPTPGIACGINLEYDFLAKVMKQAGYNTMATGKYHLGYVTAEYTPTYRGFDQWLGYYSGAEEHFTHEKEGEGENHYDLSNNTGTTIRTCPALVGPNGTYSSWIYGNYTVDWLKQQSTDTPFYAYIAWNNVHAPCEAPQAYIDRNSHIEDPDRRAFAGMMTVVDETIQKVVDQLKESGLLDSTIILVTTDNGGNLGGSGSNWPLRGGKYTFWEGGVRGNAFIYSPLLNESQIGQEWPGIVHAVDVYSTFASLGGGSVEQTGPKPADGIDFWPALQANKPVARDSLLLQINSFNPDGSKTNFTGIVRQGRWKLIVGYPGWGKVAWDGWPSTPAMGTDPLKLPKAGQHLAPFNEYNNLDYPNEPCTATPCLFDVESDPTEHNNVYSQHPDVVARLKQVIDEAATGEVSIQEAGLCPYPTGINNDPGCLAKAKQTGFWEPWR